MSTEKKLLNVDEVAANLGVKRGTIYWWVEQGRMPHCKIGKLVRFWPEEVESWLKGKSRGIDP